MSQPTTAKRDSLREYQDEILRKMSDAQQKGGGEVDLCFGFIASGRRFLISGIDVAEVVAPSQLEPVPMAKRWVLGAANIKGAVYTVTDFAQLLGMAPGRRGKFVMLNQRLLPGAALAVDSLAGLHTRDAIGKGAPAVAGQPDWLVGQYTINNEVYDMVDGQKLVADARFSRLQRGE
jgi:twitching motility protein PilI